MFDGTFGSGRKVGRFHAVIVTVGVDSSLFQLLRLLLRFNIELVNKLGA